MSKARWVATTILAILLIILTVAIAFARPATAPMVAPMIGATTRVSVASDGTEGAGSSSSPSISADGRYIAFHSLAGNLVAGDTNGAQDVFVRDRITGDTTRVSVATNGAQAYGDSSSASISGDGRFVAFTSDASNLVPGDTNETSDVFVHDRTTGVTARVSVASNGVQSDGSSAFVSISADGRYVAFASRASNLIPGDMNGVSDVFVHDQVTGEITRVSMASNGTEGNGGSFNTSISGDGRYVAYDSNATNLVPGDTNACIGGRICYDIFVRDRLTGETTRVSVASDGSQANDSSGSPRISADGRYVAFDSTASNLVPGDTNACFGAGSQNNCTDVFVHDRNTGETTLVSLSSEGAQGNHFSSYAQISADGRYVAFSSSASNLVSGDTTICYELSYGYNCPDVFVHDRTTGETTRVSIASAGTQGNESSVAASISADGRHVAFDSSASNLVQGDTNAVDDVFVHDRSPGYGVALSGPTMSLGAPEATVTHPVMLHNVATQPDSYELMLSGGSWPATIDGPAIVDLASGTSDEVAVIVSVPTDAQVGSRDTVALYATSQGNPHVSASLELTTLITSGGATTRVSVAYGGVQGSNHSLFASISGHGRFVAFQSVADSLVAGDTNWQQDIFVHDRPTGETTRVSVASDGTEANSSSSSASISDDGRFVAFASYASNLVPGDTNDTDDVFVHDRTTGETTLVIVSSDGTQGNDSSGSPSLSADGRYVAYSSFASNLAPGDTNECYNWPYYGSCADIFVYDRATGETTLVSVNGDGMYGNDSSYSPSITADGRYVVYSSLANNLVPGDANACDNWPVPGSCDDVFVYDRATGKTTRVSVASDGTEANSFSWSASISDDGRFVAFASYASNLVPGDTNDMADVFVHDRTKGETTRVSVASNGEEGNYGSGSAGISADGRYVAFSSAASNLVPGDTNDMADVFVHDRATGETTRVSVASDGTEGNSWSEHPSISSDGRYVAFASAASNLDMLAADTNDSMDIFVNDRASVYGVALSPRNLGRAGSPGTTVTYTLVLKNTGVVPDTFSLFLSGGSWDTIVEGSTTVALAPGTSSDVAVVVSVPEGSSIGDTNIVRLAATSERSPLATDAVDLVTVTGGDFHMILPLAFKP